MRKTILMVLFFSYVYFVNGLTIGVSIPPQKFFVEKIAGNSVSVVSMIKPGMDPHTFTVTPQQMIKLSKANIYFAIGIEFEKSLLKRIKNINPDIRIISLDKYIDKIEMKKIHHHDEEIEHHKHEHEHEKIHEEHEHDHHHHHGKLDPHIWLSIKNVQNMSEIMYKELIDYASIEKEEIEENYSKFLNETKKLDEKIKGVLNKSIKNRAFVVFHPAWGYFSKDYELEQIPVEVEGKEPSPLELKRFIDLSKEKNIKTIFIEGDSASRSANSIAEYLKAKTVPLYPLSEKWDKNLLYTAEKIRESLE